MPIDDDDLLRARGSDPETSHAAMAAYDREKMRAASAVVVQLYRDHGPLPDFTMSALFTVAWGRACDESLHRQARNQARNHGLVRDSGQRVQNPQTKRLQIVWEACEIPAPDVPCCPTCGRVLRTPQLQARADAQQAGTDFDGEGPGFDA